MASDDFDVEAYLEAQVDKQIGDSKEKGNVNNDPNLKEKGNVKNEPTLKEKEVQEETSDEKNHLSTPTEATDNSKSVDNDVAGEIKKSSRKHSRSHSHPKNDSRHRKTEKSHANRRSKSRSKSKNRKASGSRDRHKKKRKSRSGSRSHRSHKKKDKEIKAVSPSKSPVKVEAKNDSEEERERQKRLEEREKQNKIQEVQDLTKDQRAVFVSQLVMKAREKDVKNYFEKIVKIKVNDVIMIRDKLTNRHKGFCYVELANLEDIPTALLVSGQVPDFQKFPVLVKESEAEKNYLAKKNPHFFSHGHGGNVMVGPNVSDTRVVPGAGGTSMGLPFPPPPPPLSAGATPSNLPMNLAQSHINASQNFPVSFHPSPHKTLFNVDNQKITSNSFADVNANKLYIGNLHVNITESELCPILQSFGDLEKVEIPKDQLGMSKGYAFVTFSRVEEAQRARNSLGGTELFGMPLKVGFVTTDIFGAANNTNGGGNWKLDYDEGGGFQMNAQTRHSLMMKLGQKASITLTPQQQQQQQQQQTPCFVIKNMFDPNSETEFGWEINIKEDVEEECTKFGSVLHSYVETRQPGGLVYLLFSTVDASAKASNSLNGRWFARRLITTEFIRPEDYVAKFPEAAQAMKTVQATAKNSEIL